MYTIETICKVTGGQFLQKAGNDSIVHLVHDSRHITDSATSLFFALQTQQGDGHNYVADAYKKGVRNFVVSKTTGIDLLSKASLVLVDDSLIALQQLAAFHRNHFTIPVIGITGSNGKTIVKEWLYQLLQQDYTIVRSPKSFNSQIGVPLSVWQMNETHTLAIFEAGISQMDEMKNLAGVIQPTIGVLTNIGQAHDEGFASHADKLAEKLQLFKKAEVIIGNKALLNDEISAQTFTWSYDGKAAIQVVKKEIGAITSIYCLYKGENIIFYVPFSDEASIENVLTCCCILLYLNYDKTVINKRIKELHAVDMRLQLKHGVNQCTIINDSYSADLTSLQLALNFMVQQKTAQKRTVILSDFVESGKPYVELYTSIADLLVKNETHQVIAIGEEISAFLPQFLPASIMCITYRDTDEFLNNFHASYWLNITVLIKGARHFRFERIVQILEVKVHQTVLEINLNALAHNLKEYQKLLKPGTKIMAMVKAFSYGSGSAEIASILQFNHVDYLGVAYADEGVELRKAGITVPIMVMNADESTFAVLIKYNLEPVLYSFSLLRQFENFIKLQNEFAYPVHIEVETGMNRLGFSINDITALTTHLQHFRYLKVRSVFSHLAASEDAVQDEFTAEQASVFMQAVMHFEDRLSYTFLRHISNSAAIIRHPHLQMDMVRLGIGLYGIEITTQKLELQPVATLRTTIAQVKHLQAGETVSYNRKGVIKEDAVIATVRIGYADGYYRRLGNGVGKMWVNGHLAPVIGTVCMDMIMIDVSKVPLVNEGDEVIVFGKELPLQQLAEWAGTIPYEVMTAISQRVKRVYFQE